MLSIALASLGGGQGKTTVALFLGKLLSSQGHRVLMVDADPQASLTFYLGHEVQASDPTLLEVITGDASPDEAICVTDYPGVSLIPADNGLNAAQEHISRSGAGALLLRKRLKPITTNFDVCIIDSPPQGFQLSLSSIAAANQLLISAEAGSKGVNSLLRTLEAVYELQDLEVFTGEVLGIVPFRDKWFGRSQSECSRNAIEAMKQIADGLKIWPSIPESEAFRKSLDKGKLPKDFSPEITLALEQIIDTLEEKCLIKTSMQLAG